MKPMADSVNGPAVACLQESFAEDWYWATRELSPLILQDNYPDNGVLCQLLASGPADPQETCSLFFLEAIHSATRRVWITSPYFIPDEAVFAALRLAVLRGVDVRVLIPGYPQVMDSDYPIHVVGQLGGHHAGLLRRLQTGDHF